MLDELRRPTARRGRLVAITAVVAASVAGTALFVGLRQQGLPAELRAPLAAQVTAILEQSSPAEHHEHGHEFGEDAGRVVCAVDPFGVEPADAATVAEVDWVYARHLCAITGAGEDWAMSVRVSGPLAVRLGEQAEIRVPEPGIGYPERVRQAIPERYHEEAFGEFADDEAIDAARARFSQVH
jgi:hypothetical protein